MIRSSRVVPALGVLLAVLLGLSATASVALAQREAARAEAAALHGTTHPDGAGTAAGLAAPVRDQNATLTIQPSPRTEQGYVITAKLRNAKDNSAINEVQVRFYDLVDLLGPREMLIGTALSDGGGEATLKYLPAEAGQHTIVSRSSAKGTVPATDARATFNATITAPEPALQDELPLAAFTDLLPIVGIGLVAFVWLLFAISLVGTARKILAGAPKALAPTMARGDLGSGPAARTK